MAEIYVSTDVETDGPIPGPHSMLSFASAAYLADKTLVSTFTSNLETLPEAQADGNTLAWWATQPEAWAACRKDLQSPQRAMLAYALWVEALPGSPVFVGYPVAFDFLFVYWYLIRFAGYSPFSHSALDIKTLAMAMLKKPYRRSTKRACRGAGSIRFHIPTARSTMRSSKGRSFATCCGNTSAASVGRNAERAAQKPARSRLPSQSAIYQRPWLSSVSVRLPTR